MLGDNPGAGGQILGGRPGVSNPRVPTSVSNPGAANNPADQQMGIAAPVPKPAVTAPLYGSLSLPDVLDEEGPAHGMTLDIGIDRMLRENLELRAKYFEIPQAQADILQAGLRANPIFYADSQLVPYGKYSRNRAGGPTQYDVNISYPLDVSRKRIARTLVASRAKRVLEAQYQDAVRMQIDLFYAAFTDALVARQTVRYTQKSVEGLDRVRGVTVQLYEKDQATRADVGRARIEWEKAKIALLDAEKLLGPDQARPGHLPEPPPRRGRLPGGEGDPDRPVPAPAPAGRPAAGRARGPTRPRLVPPGHPARRRGRAARPGQPVQRRVCPVPALHVPEQPAVRAEEREPPGRSA